MRGSTAAGTGAVVAAGLLAACTTVPPPPPSAPRENPNLPHDAIAFMRIEGDEYPGQVIVRDLADGTERRITRAGIPIAFTTDGADLFVARMGEEAHALLLHPAGGGAPTELLPAVFPAPWPPVTSPDGRYVALTSDGTAPNGVIVLDLEAGTATQLTTDGAHGTARWSPDSHWIAYQVISPGTGAIDVSMIEVGGGEPRRITNDLVTDALLGWTDDGAALVVSRLTDLSQARQETVAVDVESLVATDAAGTEAATTTRSPDGEWDLAGQGNRVELRAVASGQIRSLGAAEGAAFTWSADSGWLLWTTGGDLHLVRVPGGSVVDVTDTDADELQPVWGTAPFRVDD